MKNRVLLATQLPELEKTVTCPMEHCAVIVPNCRNIDPDSELRDRPEGLIDLQIMIGHRRAVARICALGVGLLIGIFQPHVAMANDDTCSDVLRIGFVDTFSSARSSSLARALDQWVCSEESDRSLSQEGISATVPIPGLDVIVGGSYDNAKLHDWRKHNCGASRQFFSEANAESIASAVLSPFAKDAIDAWSACKKTTVSTNGISARIGSYSPEDGEFMLLIKWTPTVLVRKEPIVRSFLINNANCQPKDDIPKPGDTVGDVSLSCKRNGSRRVTVILNTKKDGPLEPSPILPAITKPPALPVWYRDQDGDGLGDLSSAKVAASQPHGYVDNGNDCNDANADARERNDKGECVRYVFSRSTLEVPHGQDSGRLFALKMPKGTTVIGHVGTQIVPVNSSGTIWGDWVFHTNTFVYKASTGGGSVPIPKPIDFDISTTTDGNGAVESYVHADRCTSSGDTTCRLQSFMLTLTVVQ
jgi:hypothetical protein